MLTPRKSLGRPFETSPLLPPRDSSSPAHLWKQVAAGNELVNSLANTAGMTGERLAKIPLDGGTSYGMHPWKIYPLIEGVLTAEQEFSLGIDSTNRWRCFRVRTGVILQDNKAQAGFNTFGADSVMRCPGTTDAYAGELSWPHSSDTIFSQLNPLFGDYPGVFKLTGDLVWNFYAELLEIADRTYNFKIGVASGGEGNSYFFDIGQVDFRTGQTNRPVVYQYISGPLNTSPSPKFYGTWSATPNEAAGGSRGYPINALVHKERGTKIATYMSTQWFNKETPGSSGLWDIVGEYTVSPS
jgi:hypothetical protein